MSGTSQTNETLPLPEPDFGETRTRAPRPPGEPSAMPPVAPDPQDDDGRPFGRYRLLEQLGRGGMGVVWKAWDTQLKRIVALKQILTEGGVTSEMVERFLREARLAAKLKHPGIVGVHDVGNHEGQRFFTSEYVAGAPLESFLSRPITPLQAAEWARDVALALAYAHEQGVVHRDIKPSNIMIDPGGRPHVMDFGLAKEVSVGKQPGASPLTMHGDVLGTPDYMSPEQAIGDVDRLGPATDQFSLGVVLYELLAASVPFRGNTLYDLLRNVARADPVRPRILDPRIPADLETICLRALEKEPERRSPAMADFAADLKRFLDHEPILARPVSFPSRVLRKAVKYRRAVVPFAVLALVSAAYALAQAVTASRESAALKLQEQGRPALERALRFLYRPDFSYEELTQKVDFGLEALQRAVEVAPHLASGHTLLGRAWELKGIETQAEACWREAIRREPDYGPAHYQLGRLLLVRAFVWGRLGRSADRESRMRALLEDAGRELELGLKSGGGGAGAEGEALRPEELLATVKLLASGDLGAVRAACREAIRRIPDSEGSEDLWWILGCVEEGEGCGEAYGRALAQRPRFALALLFRGAARDEAGDRAGARADFDAAISANPRSYPAYHRRGLLRLAMGERPGALEDLRLACEFAPPDWPDRPVVAALLEAR